MSIMFRIRHLNFKSDNKSHLYWFINVSIMKTVSVFVNIFVSVHYPLTDQAVCLIVSQSGLISPEKLDNFCRIVHNY